MLVIKTEQLTKYYGKSRGIIGLDLNVEKGDMFGFIGPNGAGKSTTVRTLLGLILPTSGSAYVFGKSITGGRNDILGRVGYLSSEVKLYGDMLVSEVIALSAGLRGRDCSEEAALLCERLRLDTSKRVGELSLGNRKKVGIVCAMQHKPELYILDEPTSGLDPLMQHEFFTILNERRENGATVFLSSHVLSEIQRYCNRAAIIRDGRLIADGTVDELSETAARRVTLQGVTAPPVLAGIADVHANGQGVSFLYRGDAKLLISAVNELDITDVTITEPDLEESFMHFYSEDGEKNDSVQTRNEARNTCAYHMDGSYSIYADCLYSHLPGYEVGDCLDERYVCKHGQLYRSLRNGAN